MKKTGPGLDDGWNVRLSYSDGRYEGYRDETIRFADIFPTRAECLEYACRYMKHLKRDFEDCIEIEFRVETSGVSIGEEFIVKGLPKQHLVRYNTRTNGYIVDDNPYPLMNSEFIAIEVPEGQKSKVKAEADRAGETIHEYVGKAILNRMGLSTWPDVYRVDSKANFVRVNS